MSQAGPHTQFKAIGSAAATVTPLAIYVDGNGDFRLSDSEDPDRVIVGDVNADYRLATSGTIAARFLRRGNDIYRIPV
jgi:hypothetical protein